MKSIGVKLVDFSDNYCWNDYCELLTPEGYSIMRDKSHFRYNYSRNWGSAIDILTYFE